MPTINEIQLQLKKANLLIKNLRAAAKENNRMAAELAKGNALLKRKLKRVKL